MDNRIEYLFEFHHQDGRIDPKPSGEYRGGEPFEVDQIVILNGKPWKVRDIAEEPGYAAKIVFDEE